MDGGPSQVDTFDPKPRLTAEHGQPFKMKMEPTQFNNNGKTLGCPWNSRTTASAASRSAICFHTWPSVDELAIVRSMTSKFSEHTNANYFLHTGWACRDAPAWAPGSATDSVPSTRSCPASSCSMAV